MKNVMSLSKKRYTREEELKMVEMFKNGESHEAIATELNRNVKTIKVKLDRMGWTLSALRNSNG